MDLTRTIPDRKKFVDVKVEFSQNSRVYNYWSRRGFIDFYKTITNSKHVLKEQYFKEQPEKVLIDQFALNNLEFGNWVTVEWRYNYIFATIISFLDLNYVLKFKANKVGLEVLNLAYGARGAGKALGHYEPFSNTINITRFHRKDKEGYKGVETDPSLSLHLFSTTGGMGSLAHEYGHFLDRNYGTMLDLQSGSFWREVVLDYTPDQLKPKPENYFHILLNAIINDEKTGNRREWFKNMYEAVKEKEKKGIGNYWLRATEIFARSFEVYVSMKLEDLKVKNKLLTKLKYERVVYPDKTTIRKCYPLFEKILKEVRERI